MHDLIKKFLFGTVPPWQFWNPQSGMAGGLIAGVLIAEAALLFLKLTK
jgi:hypothetical protein